QKRSRLQSLGKEEDVVVAMSKLAEDVENLNIKEMEAAIKQQAKLALGATLHFENLWRRTIANSWQPARELQKSVAVITTALKQEFIQMLSIIEELNDAIQDITSLANSIIFLNYNILEEYERRQRKVTFCCSQSVCLTHLLAKQSKGLIGGLDMVSVEMAHTGLIGWTMIHGMILRVFVKMVLDEVLKYKHTCGVHKSYVMLMNKGNSFGAKAYKTLAVLNSQTGILQQTITVSSLTSKNSTTHTTQIRYPRPEKEYQSFSLKYNDRSLDLICKDKDEAGVWFSGLKAMISRGQYNVDQLPLQSPYRSPPKGFQDMNFYKVPHKAFFPSDYTSGSVHSLSSRGSGHDDRDALGDVFLWGEITGNGGSHRVGSLVGAKMDSLSHKALESIVVLDVHNIACGRRHAALVTKQGEIFSWGEESGGGDSGMV
ncbi:PH, RCC1 and FYVE domains-containing protein 1-like protein isoform X1, partial [Tanacetum coccineum]